MKEIIYLSKQQTQVPSITVYQPKKRVGNSAVLIFSGGAYAFRAEHEGDGYARFLNEQGVLCFVVNYSVYPDYFPAPLADAQTAVQFVRANAEKYGVDKNKIAVMGSSAGGHLCALLSTYRKKAYQEQAGFEKIHEDKNI
ncbi:MAG: alpha/beta hydrolase, partial [Clostridia bacterium]|nr:alpha/beta hydrolase [Clostridia bacterium]